MKWHIHTENAILLLLFLYHIHTHVNKITTRVELEWRQIMFFRVIFAFLYFSNFLNSIFFYHFCFMPVVLACLPALFDCVSVSMHTYICVPILALWILTFKWFIYSFPGTVAARRGAPLYVWLCVCLLQRHFFVFLCDCVYFSLSLYIKKYWNKKVSRCNVKYCIKLIVKTIMETFHIIHFNYFFNIITWLSIGRDFHTFGQ